MSETDDIVERLNAQVPLGVPIPICHLLDEAASHITRLEERCAALTGQVETGAAEIERAAEVAAENGRWLCARAEAAARDVAALKEEVGRLREVLKTARSALVLAFSRIHALPRTTDTELAKLIGEVLAKISTALKNQEPKP